MAAFSVFDPSSFRQRLKTDPLPGVEAQKRLAPPGRFPKEGEPNPYVANDQTRFAAVLLLLYPDPTRQQLVFPLIVRTEQEGSVHSGQVAFPGGKVEPGENPLETALRETAEEIGVKVSPEQVLGELTEIYIPPSNFMVYPFVAYVEQKPLFLPDAQEVASIFETPVAKLLSDDTRKIKPVQYKGMDLLLPYLDLDQNMVWGATAMILSEFAEVWRKL
ncbi:MAG TPA: coenzyme A pyrophosphatase [Microscillaceae bacterium]|jgi:8-oxo-dGTP pyrophosphatase MutT (NUDIX family)|nr:coenzyme A pyrophosphatase [Microscillaceae bacterium]